MQAQEKGSLSKVSIRSLEFKNFPAIAVIHESGSQ